MGLRKYALGTSDKIYGGIFSVLAYVNCIRFERFKLEDELSCLES
jgi:hypothetical protein